jgi:hypothetical protein
MEEVDPAIDVVELVLIEAEPLRGTVVGVYAPVPKHLTSHGFASGRAGKGGAPVGIPNRSVVVCKRSEEGRPFVGERRTKTPTSHSRSPRAGRPPSLRKAGANPGKGSASPAGALPQPDSRHNQSTNGRKKGKLRTPPAP